MAPFFDDFLVIFEHAHENLDFVKIAVLLRKNKVFQGSGAAFFEYFYIVFGAFAGIAFWSEF